MTLERAIAVVMTFGNLGYPNILHRKLVVEARETIEREARSEYDARLREENGR